MKRNLFDFRFETVDSHKIWCENILKINKGFPKKIGTLKSQYGLSSWVNPVNKNVYLQKKGLNS